MKAVTSRDYASSLKKLALLRQLQNITKEWKIDYICTSNGSIRVAPDTAMKHYQNDRKYKHTNKRTL